MTELRKSYSEEQMAQVAKEAMTEMEANKAPGQANGGASLKVPYNKVVPQNIPPKTAEQRAAELALSKMASRPQ
jgi:hypothetical protein